MNNNLPNLTGTEKQIAWANEIRARIFDATDAAHIIACIQNEAAAGRVTDADIDRVLAKHGELTEETIARIAFDFFAAKTDAAYWIENRAASDLADKVAAFILAA